jgi:hypothetical protein
VLVNPKEPPQERLTAIVLGRRGEETRHVSSEVVPYQPHYPSGVHDDFRFDAMPGAKIDRHFHDPT